MPTFQVLAALIAAICVYSSEGQYRAIASLPPHLRNLAHCPAPGYYGDANSCVRFYRCVDYGIPNSPMLLRHDFFCAPGTVFDTELSVCNHPSRVHLSAGCHLKYAGGRVVPTIPPNQGRIQDNSIAYTEPNNARRIINNNNNSLQQGYYYQKPEMLIQSRVNNLGTRVWPNKYLLANKGRILHVQVQVPYTVEN